MYYCWYSKGLNAKLGFGISIYDILYYTILVYNSESRSYCYLWIVKKRTGIFSAFSSYDLTKFASFLYVYGSNNIAKIVVYWG